MSGGIELFIFIILIIFNLFIFIVIKNIVWPPKGIILNPSDELLEEWNYSNEQLRKATTAWRSKQ